MNDCTGIAVERIRSLTLKDFRGFTGEHCIDTDADLVLISAANGCGKTSLLEAITLLLTGWYWPYGNGGSVGEDDLRSKYASAGAVFRLRAEVDGTAGSITMEMADGELPLPQWKQCGERENRFRLIRDPKRYEDRELPARFTAFFQDRIDKLFDEAVQGNTLRDIYEPLPAGIDVLLSKDGDDALINAPGDALDEAKTRIERSPPDAEPHARRKIEADLAVAFETLRLPYLALAAGAEGWPGEDETPATVVDDLELDLWVDKILSKSLAFGDAPRGQGTLRDGLADALEIELKRQIARAEREAIGESGERAEIERELEKVKAEIAAIEREYPNLERDIQSFVALDPAQPDAAIVFRTLADNARRWSEVQVTAGHVEGAVRFRRALEELAAVDAEQARQCAQAIDDWLGPRQRALARKEIFVKRRANLEKQRDRAGASAELAQLKRTEKAINDALRPLKESWKRLHDVRDWEDRKPERDRALADIATAQRTVTWCRERLIGITGEGPNCDLMCAVQSLANTVLRRFSLVDGILPLQLVPDGMPAAPTSEGEDQAGVRRVYQVLTADGRKLCQLSTGQRAQIAVSFLVSQNLAVPEYLNHRVVVLDDVTTAYDLSNLTREAVLWRQLAYGTTDKDRRRQVFISSHHEDMTNHLLDLLVPPRGRTMRLLRITGWTPKKGPAIESFSVDPTCAAGDADTPNPARAALARDLAAF